MERLWAPWRSEYITCKKINECIFCKAWKEKKDEENYLLLRGKYSLVMLNAYPYNNGHLMIAPCKHTASLKSLKKEEREEMMVFVLQMIDLLKEVLNPEGFNLGMNLGKIAGAGVAEHLHLHIVPRWKGDNNFMPVITNTRVISESLRETYRKLRKKI